MRVAEQNDFDVLDSTRDPRNSTVLYSYGMTQPFVEEMDYWVTLPVRLVLDQGSGFCIEIGHTPLTPTTSRCCAGRSSATTGPPAPSRTSHHPQAGHVRSRAGEDLTMADQHDDATRQFYVLARLEAADDREWNSLHWTYGDAERQLKAVGEAWGVGFTLDGEPADGFERYAIEEVPVLGPEESGQAPDESLVYTLTEEEFGAWTWLIDRGIPGGLSAEEMADDFGITSDVAALRLVSLTALELAHEVSPGRYRPGSKDE